MANVVRTVRLARKLRPKQRLKLFAYGYFELAMLSGKSEQAVRLDVMRGRVDPESLVSILDWATRCRARRDRS